MSQTPTTLKHARFRFLVAILKLITALLPVVVLLCAIVAFWIGDEILAIGLMILGVLLSIGDTLNDIRAHLEVNE